MERLLRFMSANVTLCWRTIRGSMPLRVLPRCWCASDSTFITSAPNAASNCVKTGPATAWLKSKTRMPESGPFPTSTLPQGLSRLSNVRLLLPVSPAAIPPRTSSVCCPNSGAPLPMTAGDALRRNGGLTSLVGPNTGCPTSSNNPMCRTCGSLKNSSGVFTGAVVTRQACPCRKNSPFVN